MRTASWRTAVAPASLVVVAFGVSISLSRCTPASSPPVHPSGWYKGNTHTHTLNSDGDSTPREVARWYRDHGYNFLVLSDHNFLTYVDGLNELYGTGGRFLLIPGEELTDRFGDKDLHVNGLNLTRRLDPQGGVSVMDVLQRNVNAIRRENGVPHINHPNYRWSITADELKEIQDSRLFEVFNGKPSANNLGIDGVPGLEEVWDAVLSSGRTLFGIAVDDAHVFRRQNDPDVAGPGRGWVMVRAERLAAALVLDALERGDFYASTGVVLEDYQVGAASVHVRVQADPTVTNRIQFIGHGGRLLQDVSGNEATYAFTGAEGYVRARVIASNGRVAWCQPIPVPAR